MRACSAFMLPLIQVKIASLIANYDQKAIAGACQLRVPKCFISPGIVLEEGSNFA